MKVALLCRKFEANQSTGFERYAYELYNSLSGIGVDVVAFNQNPIFNIKPYGSNFAPIYYEILSPSARLIRRKGEVDIYHAIADTQGVVFPIAHGKKVVTFHHMVGKTPAGSTGENIFNRYWRIASRIAIAQADKVICISYQTKKEIMEEWDIDSEKIVVVNHGVSEFFTPGKRANQSHLIGFVGTLNRRKNIEAALRVMATLKERPEMDRCKLIICGDGSDKDRLIWLVKELGIAQSVEFRGRISDQDLPDFYRSIDAFIFPSLQEGFGIPILEAQACGTPVMVFQDAWIPEEVTRECLKCKDMASMVDALEKLLLNPDFWNCKSISSIAYASQFTCSKAAKETKNVYEEVLTD